MGNPPFEDVSPFKNGGFSIARLDYRRVEICFDLTPFFPNFLFCSGALALANIDEGKGKHVDCAFDGGFRYSKVKMMGRCLFLFLVGFNHLAMKTIKIINHDHVR